jgi:hypothetical protein
MALSALVAEHGFRQVFGPAPGTGLFFGGGVDGRAAPGAEPGVGGDILAALGAFLENHLLVAAEGTEIGIF